MLSKNIKIIVSALLIFTLAAVYAQVNLSEVQENILPSKQSRYPWRASSSTDVEFGGGSSIDVKDSAYNINFDFNLATAIKYPYATLALIFDGKSDPSNLEDWSSYSEIELRVKCRPANILHLTLLTHDEKVTKSSKDINAFRPSLAFFTCGEEWQTARINLNRLDTTEWWLERNNVNLANRDYSLDRVRAIMLSTSVKSPVNTPSNVMVEELRLKGKNQPLIYLLSTLILVSWSAFFGWVAYQFYLSREKVHVASEITAFTYKSLSLEPKYNREKEAVLNYMASEYANPNLSVEMAVNELGINRIKINEILRTETGLTFSTYLNKLRLTEAARLLSNKQVAVAEAAFAVGYNSLSYFNRLFKKEHGCNPSAYTGPTTEGKSVQNI